MKSDAAASMVFLYFFATSIVSILVALSLEKRFKARNPATRPYRWGFYVGCVGIAWAPVVPIFSLGAIVAGAKGQWFLSGLFLFGMAYILVQAVCGWFIIQRRRWAWVVGTAATLNPAQWIICGIYANNRWQEFVGVPYSPPPEEGAYHLLDIATKLETEGRVQEALAAYQRIVDRNPNTAAGQDAQKSIESLRSTIGLDRPG